LEQLKQQKQAFITIQKHADHGKTGFWKTPIPL
jgi:hypothetical protein